MVWKCGGKNGSINKLPKILYIHLWAGQEGCRGKMAAVHARQDAVHLYTQCMPWKHSQANLCTGSSIRAWVPPAPSSWIFSQVSAPHSGTSPQPFRGMHCTDTHTFCDTLRGVWDAELVSRCNAARREIERQSRKALIRLRRDHVRVSTMCEPDTCQAASCK